MFLKVDYDIMIDNNRELSEKYDTWAKEAFDLASAYSDSEVDRVSSFSCAISYERKSEQYKTEMDYWKGVRDGISRPLG